MAVEETDAVHLTRSFRFIGWFFLASAAAAQVAPDNSVTPFVSVNASAFVLDHVRVIDGTGIPVRDDQAIVVENGKIQYVGPASSARFPCDSKRMELLGYTVIPGIVGMHNHLYYTDSAAVQVENGFRDLGLLLEEIPWTAPDCAKWYNLFEQSGPCHVTAPSGY